MILHFGVTENDGRSTFLEKITANYLKNRILIYNTKDEPIEYKAIEGVPQGFGLSYEISCTTIY